MNYLFCDAIMRTNTGLGQYTEKTIVLEIKPDGNIIEGSVKRHKKEPIKRNMLKYR